MRDGAPKFSVAARLKSFGHGFRGLKQALLTEHNLRTHAAITALVLAAGVGLGLSRLDWLWIVFAIALVWVTELLNTALEYLCDALHPTHNDTIGKAKDIAAAAVMLAALNAVAVGALVFWEYV